MKTYVLPIIVVLLCVCGCWFPKTNSHGAGGTAPMSAVTSEKDTSFEFGLHIEKATAERLGFTFSRMASYFSALRMSKHEYSTEYADDVFVIGMRETPEQLRRIMDFSLKTDQGLSVKVKDLCTVKRNDK